MTVVAMADSLDSSGSPMVYLSDDLLTDLMARLLAESLAKPLVDLMVETMVLEKVDRMDAMLAKQLAEA